MKPKYIAAAIACFAYFAPLQAEAARCSSGKVYRPSAGVCVSKASAIRAGVYKPRYAKASVKHRHKRPSVERAARVKIASSDPVPSLRCDELCKLKINLHAWAARNADSFN